MHIYCTVLCYWWKWARRPMLFWAKIGKD